MGNGPRPRGNLRNTTNGKGTKLLVSVVSEGGLEPPRPRASSWQLIRPCVYAFGRREFAAEDSSGQCRGDEVFHSPRFQAIGALRAVSPSQFRTIGVVSHSQSTASEKRFDVLRRKKSSERFA